MQDAGVSRTFLQKRACFSNNCLRFQVQGVESGLVSWHIENKKTGCGSKSFHQQDSGTCHISGVGTKKASFASLLFLRPKSKRDEENYESLYCHSPLAVRGNEYGAAVRFQVAFISSHSDSFHSFCFVQFFVISLHPPVKKNLLHHKLKNTTRY